MPTSTLTKFMNLAEGLVVTNYGPAGFSIDDGGFSLQSVFRHAMTETCKSNPSLMTEQEAEIFIKATEFIRVTVGEVIGRCYYLLDSRVLGESRIATNSGSKSGYNPFGNGVRIHFCETLPSESQPKAANSAPESANPFAVLFDTSPLPAPRSTASKVNAAATRPPMTFTSTTALIANVSHPNNAPAATNMWDLFHNNIQSMIDRGQPKDVMMENIFKFMQDKAFMLALDRQEMRAGTSLMDIVAGMKRNLRNTAAPGEGENGQRDVGGDQESPAWEA